MYEQSPQFISLSKILSYFSSSQEILNRVLYSFYIFDPRNKFLTGNVCIDILLINFPRKTSEDKLEKKSLKYMFVEHCKF